MKISTWNVNGLRAGLDRGLKDWLTTESPDVFCAQEIKARPEQLSAEQRDFTPYDSTWNPADRPGYSGVATLYKKQPLDVLPGFGQPRFDVEGRVLRTRHTGLLLYNIYFPSGTRGPERVDYKLDFYAGLLAILDDAVMAGENVILAGDFNTAHTPIDLRNPAQNKKTSGFMPAERAWVDKYLEHGFVDAYRRLYPERIQYTWWTYRMAARQRNIGWRIDYFLVSENLWPRVQDVIIHDTVPGSDHCPVSLILDD
jgi:exodeoxyribonuclease-3